MNAESRNIEENRTVDLNECIQLGKLVGFWGVKGWLKVFSYTRPRKNISQYSQWLLVQPSNSLKKSRNKSHKNQVNASSQQLTKVVPVSITKCKEQGQNIVAKIDGIDFRDQAEGLLGYEVYIEKNQLKPLKKGEFYWSDMLDCEVTNLQGIVLGQVQSILETGANDVLVVRQAIDQQSLENEEEFQTESKDVIAQQSDQNDHIEQINAVEHLIPYSEEIVLAVDVQKKLISVDWGEDFLVQEVQNKPKASKKLTKQERSEEIQRQKLARQQVDFDKADSEKKH